MISLLFWMAVTGQSAAYPADVAAFLDRRTQCTHWAGEDPYDKAREAEIIAAMTKLECERVEGVERKLRSRYHGVKTVIDALDFE